MTNLPAEPNKTELIDHVYLGFVIVGACITIGLFFFGISQNHAKVSLPETMIEPSFPASTETSIPTIEPSSTPSPTSTPIPASPTPEPVSILKGLVADVLQEGNRKIPKLTELTFDESIGEIVVKVAADEHLSNDLVLVNIETDVVNITKTIIESNSPLFYRSIVIAVTYPLVNVYGDTKESNVIIATYQRDELLKVNWDNFLLENVFKIANKDSLFIHPALLK